MANLYWGGGSGNWDATSTHWYLNPQRTTPSPAAPTSADDVFFAAGVGTINVTIPGTVQCRNITISVSNFSFIYTASTVINVSNNFSATAVYTQNSGSFPTATINMIGTGAVSFGGISPQSNFPTVNFTGSATETNISIIGNHVFTNLSFTAPAVTGVTTITLDNNIFCYVGTLTASGASPTRRLFFKASSFSYTPIITANNWSASPQDVDFRDISLAGTASGTSFTRGGDCGGNSNITFPAAKTVYWNLAGAQNWSANGWALSSGGAPSNVNFPLAQDTVVFDNTGSVTGTITVNKNWNIGSINMSARTSAMTLDTSTNNPVIYGDFTYGSGITLAGTGSLTFAAKVSQSILPGSFIGAIQFPQQIVISNRGSGAYTLLGNPVNISNSLTLLAGEYRTAGYTTVIQNFVSTDTTYTRSINITGAVILCLGSGTVWNVSATNFSVSGNGQIELNSSSPKTFVGAGVSYSGVNLRNTASPAGPLTITGSNTFNSIVNTISSSAFIFEAGSTTTVNSFTANGVSGSPTTIRSTVSGSQAILYKSSGTVSCSYVDIQDSNATGGATWNAPLTSGNINSGNNSGWIFGAAYSNTGNFFLMF